ncbi:putative nuclease HARBI1 [Ischnura elegans]|uniref:putative nuclease HARBI1 n=1 Tax=Ischnura elegans TaxID=197161 RepID=UPI001ED8AE2A|nr:putative nuclease HARBI1 [Ischnura elegans]
MHSTSWLLSCSHGDAAQEVITGFHQKSGFPGILGAIDGCHVAIIAPKGEGAVYVNRKGHHSIQFQGICNHKCVVTHIYAGHAGSVHDQRVFNISEVSDFLRGGEEFFPGDSHLIADAAYAIDPHFMVPYKDHGHMTERQRFFNRSLSQARMVIERAFGLMKGRWRSLLNCLPMTCITKIPQYIITCAVLHNVCEVMKDNFEGEMPLGEGHLIMHDDPAVLPDAERRQHGNAKRERIAWALMP